LHAQPAGQSVLLLQPQVLLPRQTFPPDAEAQSAGPPHPQAVPLQIGPWGDVVQLTHPPGVPQLWGVPRQAPESVVGTSGGASTGDGASGGSEGASVVGGDPS
jgi:hypothetical protein